MKIKKALRPLYYIFEDFIEAGAVQRNKRLRDLHNSQRCFILGNGFSLSEIDISSLSSEWIFGCNCLYLHENIADLNLNFFVSSAAVRKSKRASIERLISHFSHVEKMFNNPNTVFFSRAINKRLFERHNMFKDRRMYYLKPKPPLTMKETINEPIDLTKRCSTLYGSVASMITIAIYMGFKEIYLCGCGYTYKPQQIYHFYDYDPKLTSEDRMQDPLNDPRPLFPLSIPDVKRKRMIKEYAQREGFEIYNTWEEDSYEKVIFVSKRPMEDQYEILNKIAVKKGVNIYNIVPRGFESPVFEKIIWEKITKEKLGPKNAAA